MSHTLLIKYGVAVLVVGLALGLRLLLHPFLGAYVPFITFFFAVMVAAWFGGLGPGVAAAILSTIVADYFFVAPLGSTTLKFSNILALGLFILEAIGISFLSGEMHRARGQAERRRLEMEHLLESISDAFAAIDAQGRYTVVNRRAAELLGQPIEDLRGRQLRDHVPACMTPDHVAELEASAQSRTARRFECFHDPSQRWFETRLYPYEGGLSIFFSDITERKQAEQRLTQWNVDLERRVRERTENLTASHTRLRALASELSLAEQRERRRLATELHDSLAQMLALAKIKLSQLRHGGPSPAALDQLTQDVEQIVRDALTYTRTMIADLSPPLLHQFGLVPGIRWLAEQMGRHGLTVEVQATHSLPALAEDRLSFAFHSIRELLLNVVKHARTDAAVVRVSVDADQSLQVSVMDRGCGFDPGRIAVSDRFGLFSIRERIEALGGRFQVLSTGGEGTEATLTLPIHQKPSRIASGDVAPHPDAHASEALDGSPPDLAPTAIPLRVLLVDDHALVRQGLESVLKGFSDLHIIGEAADGREAVDSARRLHPDVVLMDVNMPGMDGIEATRMIKQELPDTTVIGLSVNLNSHIERAMREAGASAYLTKETAVDELHAVIHDALHATS